MENGQMATEVASETPPNGSAPEGDVPERAEAAERDSSRLFEHQAWVHVGPAAEGCPDGENGKCNDPMHFHAWIRLPNPFQQSSIREKANAAKARRLRQLRDPESDARVIVDEAVADMVRADDREGIIDQLVGKDFLSDHLKAMQEVSSEEEYEHIDDDRERLRALNRMPEDQRPAEEYDELTAHVAAYGDAVEKARLELEGPLRASLAEKDTATLGELLKEQLIEQDAQQAWNDTYDKWEWFVCTMKPRNPQKGLPNERRFDHIDHMTAAAPEVHYEMRLKFADLEAKAGRQVKGF